MLWYYDNFAMQRAINLTDKVIALWLKGIRALKSWQAAHSIFTINRPHVIKGRCSHFASLAKSSSDIVSPPF